MPIVNEKKTLKMPSLLAFLPMFGRTNESFENPHYKGKKENRVNSP
jgi:hypothetical protein